MKPCDYLSVRFHFRGEFHHDGTEWKYSKGRSGISTVEYEKLCLQELKKHLADHVSCCDEVLNGTTLHWKFPLNGRGALVVMDDEESVLQMVKHVADAGIIDLYAKIPGKPSQEPNDWETEQGEGQWAEQHEEQWAEEEKNSEEWRGDAEEMHEAAVDAHVFHQPQKLPVFRKIVKGSSSIAGKSNVAQGKINKGGEDESTSTDSDYEVGIEEDKDNSSADDEEAIEFRKYARELKNKVRNKMLGEEDEKGVDVPEDFLVPEDCKLDDGDGDVTPYFDSAPCYSIYEYNKIYDHVLQPVNGPEDWPISEKPRPLPPKKRTQTCRPQTKRRQEEGEKPRDGSKMSRAGTQVTCSSCGTQGHNKRKCTNNSTAGNKEHANFTRAARRRNAKQARTEQAPNPSTQQSSAPGPSTQKGPRAYKPPNRKKAPVSSKHPSTEPFYERAKNRRKAQTQSSQPPCATSSFQPAPGSTSQPLPNQSRFQWWLYGDN